MKLNTGSLFVDTGYAQTSHFGERACGDAVAFRRIPEEERMIAVLADGLGHGIKAAILAQMTATMALRFSAEDREVTHFAEIIMDALPVCQERQISYSTFTIVDCRLDGLVRVVEMGNPDFLLLRRGRPVLLKGETFASPKYEDRVMTAYAFTAEPEDRMIFFSDGVTQAGLGTPRYPLGWQNSGVEEYLREVVAADQDVSAQDLAEKLLREAVAHEPGLKPADDITAVCLHFRKPHRMLLLTGPPYDQARDHEYAEAFRDFEGDRVIAGGTTSDIIARELGLAIAIDFDTMGGDLPPESRMEGADMVTEGIFTLTRAARYLDEGNFDHDDPAARLARLMRRNDIIEFLVGTRINEAHQDPNLPVDLELRRNIVIRLGRILRERYLKEVVINFI